MKVFIEITCENTGEKVALEKKYSEKYLDSAIVKDAVSLLSLGICELRYGKQGCDCVIDCLNNLTATEE